ncbi:MAG: IS200/IS605 family element transposase accessory protein TnpB [Pleurocapsa sp. CRU_1_2]|nr:IS200/IS605 family element transposase accessory protein TnpB [Pleurocapsa sp. CRU_1_2]
MIVLEYKLKGKDKQFRRIDDAIRTAQFVRNKCIRLWRDNRGINKTLMFRHNTELRATYPWCHNLNSHACQASVERATRSIDKFYSDLKDSSVKKKSYPKFKKHSRSVEYKQSGWKITQDRKRLTITDKTGIGSFRLVGSRDLHFYQLEQIKRMRLIRRADGYYAQFSIQVDRNETRKKTGTAVGLDLGLKYLLADSNSNFVLPPKFLRKAEKRLKRLQRRMSKKYDKQRRKDKQSQSNNYHKSRIKLARQHLKISRQRKDFAVKLARCVVISNDIVAFEDLKVKNLVKNRHLSKSISDASWGIFRQWIEYFGKIFGVETIAVPPHYTSTDCSACGARVKKSLSTRTHICKCGCELDRDTNASINILNRGLNTLGRREFKAQGDEASMLPNASLVG